MFFMKCATNPLKFYVKIPILTIGKNYSKGYLKHALFHSIYFKSHNLFSPGSSDECCTQSDYLYYSWLYGMWIGKIYV